MSICTVRTVARCSGSIEPVCSHCSSPDATMCQAFSDLQFAFEPHRYTPRQSLLQYPEVISLERRRPPSALGRSPKEKRPDLPRTTATLAEVNCNGC